MKRKHGYVVVKLYQLYIGNEFTGHTYFDYHAAIKMRNSLRETFKANEIDLPVTLVRVNSDEI